MDILAGLRDKLRFIERHYAAASAPFREIRRQINDREEPFELPPFDPEIDDGEPPFLVEWQEATQSLNIEGQAALKIVQAALREYLSSFVGMYGIPLTAKGKNWFEKYNRHFLDAYNIDFEKAPIPLDELEEVNLARNDTEHSGEPFGMTRRQSEQHARRFPGGLFVDEIEKQLFQESDDLWPKRIEVTEAGLKEAIRRVETFCEFLDAQRDTMEFFARIHSAGG